MYLKIQNNYRNLIPIMNQIWLVAISFINIILSQMNNNHWSNYLNKSHLKKILLDKRNLNTMMILITISFSDKKLLNSSFVRMILYWVQCITSCSNHRQFSYLPKHLPFSLAHQIKYHHRINYLLQDFIMQVK